MGNNILLFESLFNTKISTENIQDYLEQVATEYPYFSPAQFFLLNKLQPGTPEFNEQAAKTSVLFNNAHWLNFQLQETRDAINNLPYRDVPVVTSVADETQEIVEEKNVDTTSHTQNEVEEHALVGEDLQTAAEEPITIETVVEPGEEGTTTEHTVYEDAIKVLDEIEEEPAIDGEPAQNEPEEELQIDMAHLEELKTSEIIIPEETAIEALQDQEITSDASPVDSAETEDPDDTDNDGGRSPENGQHQQPLSFKLNMAQEDTKEETISFEPLHTTDYFASLGIKLSNEIKPTDKLGKQLKSFTEWLKTMKKIHTEQLGETSGQADQVIQTLADRSNTEDEVLTEAMAEVLVQQDKITKAIEVYKKLSLLNPAKSAYFAGKIDQLKK